MNAVQKLIELDRQTKKKIAVVGDAMTDAWVHGTLSACQEGSPLLVRRRTVHTPGGAANAARQLWRWNAEAFLIAPLGRRPDGDWSQVRGKLVFEEPFRLPVKSRFVNPQGVVIFRDDDDEHKDHRLDNAGMAECRRLMPLALRHQKFDAVLISDYDKGFLDDDAVRAVIDLANDLKIPVVADAKRHPDLYTGAVLKCNANYYERNSQTISEEMTGSFVVTNESAPPEIYTGAGPRWGKVASPSRKTICVNHVGAGDSFSAHLTLALAHGLPLEDAAVIAHSAGRVYVQHEHGRPPWPHEIAKDNEPAGGKVLSSSQLSALRQSASGRLVCTNGVFRLPHAGHAWFLRWAKSQGGVLVVLVNDDASAAMVKKGEYVLPLASRVEMLASMEAVDWVVPFSEREPYDAMSLLAPDVLVKGAEYQGQRVPGDMIAQTILFAPPGPFPEHVSTLVDAIRR